ncbi:MAG: ChaN family lipoprotein [Planctomycetota bacterium]
MSYKNQDVSPRAELIGIQKRLLKRIKQILYAEYCLTNPWIDAYYDDYKKLTSDYERIVSKAEMLDAVIQSDIVYLGDYHTLRQSQKALIRILEPILNSKFTRPIIIGLEMFRAEHQIAIDRFLKGKIKDVGFLKSISYEKTWGFDWNHYKVLLNFAREHKIKVYGLNTRDIKGKNTLARRDGIIAETIADTASKNPKALFLILFGDLHISENHLPRAVDEVFGKTAVSPVTRSSSPAKGGINSASYPSILRGLGTRTRTGCEVIPQGANRGRKGLPALKRLIICQNSERIYWKLASQGLEQTAEVVKIKDGVYCIMNSTPLMVFQSCLNWQYREKELKSCPVHPGWCEGEKQETLLPEEMAELVKAICEFLNLEIPPLDRFTICSAHDFDVLEKVKEKLSSPIEKDRIAVDLARTESYFIREANLICLSNLSLNHAAEEAAHLIHYHYALTGEDGNPVEVKRAPIDNFYYNVIREALGFFGSKIINHKRLCSKERDFQDLIKRYANKRVIPYWVRAERKIGQTVLEHIKRERNYIDTSGWKAYRKIRYMDLDNWVGVSQSIGYILGDKLYNGVMQDIISRGEIRELFLKPFTPSGEPLKSYLYLVRRTESVREIFAGKDDHL